MSDHNEQRDQAEAKNIDQEVAEALGDLSVMDLLEEDGPAVSSPTPGRDMSSSPTTCRGTVVAIHDDDVFVELGGKSQGVLPITQFDEPPQIGQEMEFVIESLLGDEGLIKLSRKHAVEKATWDSLERGMVIEAKVTGVNTGGLELKVAGQRAFMPASQIDLGHIENLSQFLNQKLHCKVMDLDRRRKNIVLSRRAVLEEQKAEKAKEVLAEIAPGQVRQGTVRSLQKFGAFVDLGGVDGLIHISDLSYQRVNDPADVVQVGQTVQVKVLKVDADANRISLGLKQVQPDPWLSAEQNYPVGAQVTGRVTKLADFGAFVELEPGIEGLIPMAELSWSRINTAKEVVQQGQVVNSVVLNVDVRRHRLSLSLKQLQDDPWKTADQTYMPGTVVKGTITRTAPFGAFVQLEPGVEGMIHISELSDRRVGSVEEVVQVGQEVETKVLTIDPDQHRIGLSIRALTAPTDQSGDSSGRPSRGGRATRDDLRKYVKRPDEARATESLMGKWGDPHKGGLKGGLG